MNEKVSVSIGLKAGQMLNNKPYQADYTLNYVLGSGPQIVLKNGLEKKGASFNAYTTFEYALASGEFPAESLSDALKMLGLSLKNRKFIPILLEESKFNTVTGLQQIAKDPNPIPHARLEIYKQILGNIGAGMNYNATEDSVKALGLQDVEDFYRSFYRPEDMVISVVGNLDYDTVVKAIDSALGDWVQNAPTLTVPKAVLFPPKEDNRKKVTVEAQQSIVVWSAQTVNRSDKTNYVAMMLANEIFGGGGLTSRLSRTIRDREGLSYGVGTYPINYGDLTIFRGFMQIGGENVNKGIDLYFRELKNYMENGPTEMEVVKFQSSFINNEIFGYQTGMSIAANLLFAKLSTGDVRHSLEFLSIINSLSQKYIKDSMKKIFPDKYYWVIVGE